MDFSHRNTHMLTMSITDRNDLRAGLVETLKGFDAQFHIVAEIAPQRPRAALEDALYQWAARVDRLYLGRKWQASPRRMRGAVFFERRPYWHAHMLVAPPVGVHPVNFHLNVASLFRPAPCQNLRRSSPRPAAREGKMFIRRIGSGPSDLEKVARYVIKDVRSNSQDEDQWKFIELLSPRHHI